MYMFIVLGRLGCKQVICLGYVYVLWLDPQAAHTQVCAGKVARYFGSSNQLGLIELFLKNVLSIFQQPRNGATSVAKAAAAVTTAMIATVELKRRAVARSSSSNQARTKRDRLSCIDGARTKDTQPRRLIPTNAMPGCYLMQSRKTLVINLMARTQGIPGRAISTLLVQQPDNDDKLILLHLRGMDEKRSQLNNAALPMQCLNGTRHSHEDVWYQANGKHLEVTQVEPSALSEASSVCNTVDPMDGRGVAAEDTLNKEIPGSLQKGCTETSWATTMRPRLHHI
jgi:hypothetical protein